MSTYVDQAKFEKLRQDLGVALMNSVVEFGRQRNLTLDVDALHAQIGPGCEDGMSKMLYFGFDIWPDSIPPEDRDPEPVPQDLNGPGRTWRSAALAASFLCLALTGLAVDWNDNGLVFGQEAVYGADIACPPLSGVTSFRQMASLHPLAN